MAQQVIESVDFRSKIYINLSDGEILPGTTFPLGGESYYQTLYNIRYYVVI